MQVEEEQQNTQNPAPDLCVPLVIDESGAESSVEAEPDGQ